MNEKQAFVIGFIKQAVDSGFTETEALNLLKKAGFATAGMSNMFKGLAGAHPSGPMTMGAMNRGMVSPLQNIRTQTPPALRPVPAKPNLATQPQPTLPVTPTPEAWAKFQQSRMTQPIDPSLQQFQQSQQMRPGNNAMPAQNQQVVQQLQGLTDKNNPESGNQIRELMKYLTTIQNQA